MLFVNDSVLHDKSKPYKSNKYRLNRLLFRAMVSAINDEMEV
jgi:hypothetical protein